MNIFSSPAEEDGDHNERAKRFFEMCDPNPEKLINYGKFNNEDVYSTQSRVFRWFNNPLEGIHSFYDKYGEADSQQIYEYIIRERNSKPNELRAAEIRKYPMNYEEAFGSFDSSATWTNIDGLKSRRIYLMGTRFRDEQKTEPKFIVGRLDWEDNIQDTRVIWKPSEKTWVDEKDRFAFSRLPQISSPIITIGRDKKKAPKKVESVIGLDPYDFRRVSDSRMSYGAGSQFKFSDLLSMDGRKRKIDSVYFGRPPKPEIFYEDVIKWMIFTNSLLQTENKNQNVINYLEDRGYFDWILPKNMNGDPSIKGNAPGNSGLLDDMMTLFDSFTAESKDEQESGLDDLWFDIIIDQALRFDPNDTKRFDMMMAVFQALYGAQKLISRYRNSKGKNQSFNEILNEIING